MIGKITSETKEKDNFRSFFSDWADGLGLATAELSLAGAFFVRTPFSALLTTGMLRWQFIAEKQKLR
jgi:hypothetical protein